MTGKTHRVGGIAAGIILFRLSKYHTVEVAAPVLSGAVLGSLLPDIDHPQSTISRKLWFASWPLMILRAGIRQIAHTLPKSREKRISGIIGHRGITHSLLACLSVGITFLGLGFLTKDYMGSSYPLYKNFSIGLIAGMLSHLCLDFISNGIPLFCPVINKRYGFKWIKTGSLLENLFFILLVIGLAVLIGIDNNQFFEVLTEVCKKF